MSNWNYFYFKLILNLNYLLCPALALFYHNYLLIPKCILQNCSLCEVSILALRQILVGHSFWIKCGWLLILCSEKRKFLEGVGSGRVGWRRPDFKDNKFSVKPQKADMRMGKPSNNKILSGTIKSILGHKEKMQIFWAALHTSYPE